MRALRQTNAGVAGTLVAQSKTISLKSGVEKCVTLGATTGTPALLTQLALGRVQSTQYSADAVMQLKTEVEHTHWRQGGPPDRLQVPPSAARSGWGPGRCQSAASHRP